MICLKNRQQLAVFAVVLPALVFVACKSETHNDQQRSQGMVSFQRYQPPQLPQAELPNTSVDSTTVTTLPKPDDANLYSVRIEREFQMWKAKGFFDKTAGTDGQSRSYLMPTENYTCGQSAPDCLNKFVRINMQNAKEGLSCTGVLIASDLVLTNRHCVPFMDEPNTSFGDYTIVVDLPGQITANVTNLVGMSPKWLYGEGHLNVDFAILKLDRQSFTQLSPLKQLDQNPYSAPEISHEGFQNGKTYYVYSTTPYKDKGGETVIEKRPCKAIYNTIFASQFQSPQAPVVSLADCPIGPGNSGSPIYNEEGQLVGLISGQFNPYSLLGLTGIAKSYGMLTTGELNDVGWGTNFACLPSLVGESYKVDPKCNDGIASATLTSKRNLDPALEEQAKQLLTHDMQDNQFQYQIARGDRGALVSDFLTSLMWLRIPRCVNSSVLDSNDKLSLKTGMVGMQIDQNGVVLSQLGKANDLSLQLEFDHNELKTKGATEMKALDGKFLYYTGKLELCH